MNFAKDQRNAPSLMAYVVLDGLLSFAPLLFVALCVATLVTSGTVIADVRSFAWYFVACMVAGVVWALLMWITVVRRKGGQAQSR